MMICRERAFRCLLQTAVWYTMPGYLVLLAGLRIVLEIYLVEKEIKNRVSASVGNPDYLLRGIQTLYEINAGYRQKIQQFTNDKGILRNKNTGLQDQIKQLKEENRRLKGVELDMQPEYDRGGMER